MNGTVARMSESRAKLDLDAAAAFLEMVPSGRWTSYGDVAMAVVEADTGPHTRRSGGTSCE